MNRRLKLKLRKKDIFFALLVLAYAFRAFTDAVFVSRGVDSTWVTIKYVVLLFAIIYGVCYLAVRGKRLQNIKIAKLVGIAWGTFFVISCLKMLYTGFFSTDVFELLIYMAISAVMAVLITNIGTQEDIYSFFSWVLCVCFAMYCVFEVGLDYFGKEYFNTISFSTSFSPFESHYSSGTAMVLCAYFCYFRKRKIFTLLALMFSLLTFKRLAVVFSIILFVLPIVTNPQRKLNKYIPIILSVAFCVVTVVYYWYLIPENQDILIDLLKIESVAELTSSRSIFFSAVYSNPFFINFGWGSCETYLGRMIEMDLIQMLIEVSFVGLAVFVFSYWSLAGTTIFGLIYMGYNFLNMLTSHSIQNGFIWGLILVSLVQMEHPKQQLLSNNKNSPKIRRYLHEHLE